MDCFSRGVRGGGAEMAFMIGRARGGVNESLELEGGCWRGGNRWVGRLLGMRRPPRRLEQAFLRVRTGLLEGLNVRAASSVAARVIIIMPLCCTIRLLATPRVFLCGYVCV